MRGWSKHNDFRERSDALVSIVSIVLIFTIGGCARKEGKDAD